MYAPISGKGNIQIEFDFTTPEEIKAEETLWDEWFFAIISHMAKCFKCKHELEYGICADDNCDCVCSEREYLWLRRTRKLLEPKFTVLIKALNKMGAEKL